MRNDAILFLTSRLSRQLIAFAKQMGREKIHVIIAAPANENCQYLPERQFIRLVKFGGRLFGASKVRGVAGKAVCFDKQSAAFAKKAGVAAAYFQGNVGIDLSVWSPEAISGNRQTMLLSQYNIQPHQKMLLAVDPTEKEIKALTLAIQGLERSDYIIALYGRMTRGTAKRVSRKIAAAARIIYLGKEQDLPTLMRASFAILSLSEKESFYKIAAIAMGRTTAWKQSEIKPNIVIKDNLPSVLEKILDLPVDSREKFESENVRRAQNYSFEKNIKKLKELLA